MESNANASEVQVDTNVDDVSLNSTETKDGKERALCKYCKTSPFISNSSYGTSNMQKHLEKCKHYDACKKSSGAEKEELEENVYDKKFYRELVATTIIKHVYAFSWVEHEVTEDEEFVDSFVDLNEKKSNHSHILNLGHQVRFKIGSQFGFRVSDQRTKESLRTAAATVSPVR
ncbi:hypothetical protein GQ457_10G014470 [Hibiscus cannabinus]